MARIPMLVLDQLMGLKVALQNPLFHMLFLIVLACTNTGDAFSCQSRSYESAYIFLMFCHVFAFIPFLTTCCRLGECCKCIYFEKSLELSNLVLYLLAIFYVQDVLFFDIGYQNCMDQDNLGLRAQDPDLLEQRCSTIYCNYNDLGDIRDVFTLEVYVFYLQIVSLVIFQALNYTEWLNPETTLTDEDVEKLATDSIEVHQANFGLLSANFVASLATFTVIKMEEDIEVPPGASKYGWSLWMNFILNIWFTITLFILIAEL